MQLRQTNIQGEVSATDLVREAAEQSLDLTIKDQQQSQVTTPFGSGLVYVQEVQPGLRCELHDFCCHTAQVFECSAGPQLTCSITLEGQLDGIDIQGYGLTKHQPKRATLIGFPQQTQWTRRLSAGQSFKAYCLSLQPEFIERFASDIDAGQLAALNSFRSQLKAQLLPHSQRLIHLGHQAFEHCYSGGLAALYQESNTLQFVLEVLHLIGDEGRLVQQIGQGHYQRFMQARAILDNSLLNPPKTLDLARQVGTNITSLQAHFKLALGTTIFGYVKAQRLEMARVLLSEHKLNVADTAYRVGFTSPSAFTASYRRHFGHPPTSDC